MGKSEDLETLKRILFQQLMRLQSDTRLIVRLIPYQQTQLEKQSINLLLNMTEEKSLIKDLNATVLNHLTVQNVAKCFRFFNYYRIMLMIVWTDHDNEVSHINK